jgi:hypothetical protein
MLNRLLALQDDGRLGSLPLVSGEPGVDAFGRVRTSEPYSLFEQTFRRTAPLSIWDLSTSTGGTITHDANLVSMLLNTTTDSGSRSYMQSRVRVRYSPGKSQLFLFTGNLKAGVSNVRRRGGLFDESNGPFFQQIGATLSVGLRSSVSGSAVDTIINQSSWNIDKLDGTGSSGLTLDITKQQIFCLDFQWLGSGRVRFGFQIGGRLVYCHEINNANQLTVPYSRTGSLPVRFEQENLAALGDTPSSMHITCISVQSESGIGIDGRIRSADLRGTARAISSSFATALPIISIRKQSAFAKFPIEILNAQIFGSTADDLLVSMVKNPTLTAPSWTAITDSLMEVDRSATAISGGTSLGSMYVRANSGTESSAFFQFFRDSLESNLGCDISNNSDILTMMVQSVSGAASAFAAINWKEFD